MKRALFMHTFEDAKKKTLNILSRRSHCEKELIDKLEKYGFDHGVIAQVIEWAREYNFVCDKDYGRRYIEMSIAKKHGIRRIKQDLQAKGVERYLVEDLIAQIDIDEMETLKPLIQKKLRGDFSPKNKASVSRFFAGKGFSFSDISDAMRAISNSDDE